VRALAAVALGLVGLAAPAQEWRPFVHAQGIVDVVKLDDGTLTVSTRSGLYEVQSGALKPFARTYAPTEGGEQYAAAVPSLRTPAAGCSWRADDIFVLDASATPGLIRVPRGGDATRFYDFPKGAFPSGITWDAGGRFAHRLLVTTIVKNTTTTLYAIDCRGRGSILRRGGPRVEGGIVVSPSAFGRFGGRLIAANEVNGTIYAFDPRGRATVVARPAVRRGPDLGIESLGFAPAGATAAYLADLGAPGSPTEGTDSLLVLERRVAPGVLVAASEGGATTVAVRCAKACSVTRVADGPAQTHGEGHVVFASSP
jgi:hypothetical protein